MIQSFFLYDRALFTLVNSQWSNPFFDWLMPLLRNSTMWVPLYLFMVLVLVINFKKEGWWLVLLAVATAVVSNYISSDLIKGNIMRIRPCNEDALADNIRVLVGYRPQSSSFTSSHATNHFAIAMLLFTTLKKRFGSSMWIWFVWAASICYAQVYVGVHYPLDVAGGAIIGILIGYLPGKWFNKRFSLL